MCIAAAPDDGHLASLQQAAKCHETARCRLVSATCRVFTWLLRGTSCILVGTLRGVLLQRGSKSGGMSLCRLPGQGR